jgi:MoaA/NifB/PqqE/SkfB family radical SAM enzyme
MKKLITLIFAMIRLVLKNPVYFSHLVKKKYALFGRYTWIKKNITSAQAAPPPLVYKIHLTNQCNLRCTMCMLWGQCGLEIHKDKAPSHEHFDWPALQNLIKKSKSNHASFIFSGGEPFLYPHIEALLGLLKESRCHASFCTNGTLLFMYENALADNPYISLLISLDGLQTENDGIRGSGIYAKVVKNITDLQKKKTKIYTGIQFTIQPENVHRMYAFCEEMEKLGVDWVLFNLCWALSQEQADQYTSTLRTVFGVTPKSQEGVLYKNTFDEEIFTRQLDKIHGKKWHIQISCYLKNSREITTFVNSKKIPCSNSVCFKQWIRMDILPNGDVTPCILFPDLIFGNILKKSVEELWNGPEFKKFRNHIRRAPLSICSRCNGLYLYNPDRLYL